MILILSQQHREPTTEMVMDWISAKQGKCLRINGEDISNQDVDYKLDFNRGRNCVLYVNDQLFDLEQVNVVWFRRWHEFANLDQLQVDDPGNRATLRGHLFGEIDDISDIFYDMLKNKYWVSHPEFIMVNKQLVLLKAKEAGLAIPNSIITNNKRDLLAFFDLNQKIITKPLSPSYYYFHDGKSYSLYAEEITPEQIEQFHNRFFPTLFQSLALRKYELRVFYLDGTCYATAKLTPHKACSTTDIKLSSKRIVPYRMPEDVEKKIDVLMKNLQLNTGSIDIIKTTADEYVFLEVNPVGQFSYPSYMCNYFLEEKMAEFLIKKDHE